MAAGLHTRKVFLRLGLQAFASGRSFCSTAGALGGLSRRRLALLCSAAKVGRAAASVGRSPGGCVRVAVTLLSTLCGFGVPQRDGAGTWCPGGSDIRPPTGRLKWVQSLAPPICPLPLEEHITGCFLFSAAALACRREAALLCGLRAPPLRGQGGPRCGLGGPQPWRVRCCATYAP